MKKSFKKHYVAFLDILGYKNLVIEASKDEQTALYTIEKLEDMINKTIHEMVTAYKKFCSDSFRIDYTLFSDSLCFYVPLDESEGNGKLSNKYIETNYFKLYFLCRLVATVQLESLKYGIIYRGAISLDNHYHSNNITFSKALINAYLAESTKAIYPRVIILDTPENDILEYIGFWYNYFDMRIVEDDDYLFVDYLGMIDEFSDILGEDCDYIKWHKQIIEKGIKNNLHDEKTLAKYTWMLNYHYNRLIPIFGGEVCLSDEFNRFRFDILA